MIPTENKNIPPNNMFCNECSGVVDLLLLPVIATIIYPGEN